MSDQTWINVGKAVRALPPSRTYGALGPSRLDPVEHHPTYAELPPDGKALVDALRGGTPRSAMFVWRGQLWFFEWQPAGGGEGDRRFGYTVRGLALPTAAPPRRWRGWVAVVIVLAAAAAGLAASHVRPPTPEPAPAEALDARLDRLEAALGRLEARPAPDDAIRRLEGEFRQLARSLQGPTAGLDRSRRVRMTLDFRLEPIDGTGTEPKPQPKE